MPCVPRRTEEGAPNPSSTSLQGRASSPLPTPRLAIDEKRMRLWPRRARSQVVMWEERTAQMAPGHASRGRRIVWVRGDGSARRRAHRKGDEEAVVVWHKEQVDKVRRQPKDRLRSPRRGERTACLVEDRLLAREGAGEGVWSRAVRL